MKIARLTTPFLLAALCFLAAPRPAEAHQPYFEDEDWSADRAYRVQDPTVSTALYATLESRTDVDYVTFTGRSGQRILLGVTIPQIAGQENFAPTIALIGPELPTAPLPKRIAAPAGSGALVLAPDPGPATEFFEPFSGTRYWERQEARVTLPVDGEYRVAVWADDRSIGRYTLVVGDRETPGGDIAFPFKLRAYWTPVPAPPETIPSEPTATAHHCGGR
ncbi:MAG: hypothetical protein IAE81_08335 [Caldilineaceae bacterium]|jgi:hypothetical protein|nr:hypothetical protein [Caldilineaceae bacterium]